MAELSVRIRTLTPLWTGGVARVTDRLHETGILGSLRWWGEAVLRSRGGSACDPSQHECPDNKGHYCDACAFFGTTGLKRIFSIDWSIPQNPGSDKELRIRVRNNRGWFLKRALLLEDLKGKFVITRQLSGVSAEEAVHFLALLFRIISDWGGLGARTQQGYGVSHVITEPKLDLSKALRTIEGIRDRENRKDSVGQDLPRLDSFFFAKVRFRLSDDPERFIRSRTTEVTLNGLRWYVNNGILPLAPIVRYYLRQLIGQQILYAGKSNAPARWRLMGVVGARYHPSDLGKVKPIRWECSKCSYIWTSDPGRGTHRDCGGRIREREWQCDNCGHIWNTLEDLKRDTREIERYKSLIHVSHAYPAEDGESWYEFRIWGWLPQELPGGVQRNAVLGKLRQWLGVSNPADLRFQNARGGTLWNPSHVNLGDPLVLWRESPKVEDLLKVGGDGS